MEIAPLHEKDQTIKNKNRVGSIHCSSLDRGLSTYERERKHKCILRWETYWCISVTSINYVVMWRPLECFSQKKKVATGMSLSWASSFLNTPFHAPFFSEKQVVVNCGTKAASVCSSPAITTWDWWGGKLSNLYVALRTTAVTGITGCQSSNTETFIFHCQLNPSLEVVLSKARRLGAWTGQITERKLRSEESFQQLHDSIKATVRDTADVTTSFIVKLGLGFN